RPEPDRQVLLEFALASELIEPPGPQTGLDLEVARQLAVAQEIVGRPDARIEELVTHGAPPTTSMPHAATTGRRHRRTGRAGRRAPRRCRSRARSGLRARRPP